jgi:hypothetical protein
MNQSAEITAVKQNNKAPAQEKDVEQERKKNEEGKIDDTLQGVFYSLIGIVILLIIIILISYSARENFPKALIMVGAFLLLGGAYFLGGASVGFLFAIPRSGTFRYKPGQENSKSWYDDNTNLEEISDWLTKIIVGITLVQFDKIQLMLKTSANSIARSFSSGGVIDQQFYPWAYGMIVFFITCGFVISYLWTRINFALILTVSRKRLNEISSLEAKQAEAENKLEKAEAQLDTVRDKVASTASQENVRKGNETSFVGEIDPNADNRKAVLQTMIDNAKNKPVIVKDDLQKGRWGGRDINNNKQLYAEVTKSENVPGFYHVLVKVKSTVPGGVLEGPVAFFVHDSFGFPDNVVIADPDVSGIAAVNLVAYEAFTVGALCYDGTELELDLNQVKGFPTGFYWS